LPYRSHWVPAFAGTTAQWREVTRQTRMSPWAEAAAQ
jgi:hypothetical protein